MPCSQIFLHLLKNVKILLGFFKIWFRELWDQIGKPFKTVPYFDSVWIAWQWPPKQLLLFSAGIQSTLNTDGQAVHDFGNLPVRCSLASQLTLTYFDARK